MGYLLIGVAICVLILFLDSRVFRWSDGTDHVIITLVAVASIAFWPIMLIGAGMMIAVFALVAGVEILINFVYGEK